VYHVYTAVKRGHPSHAISHMTSVGAIGQAEVKKHAKGPLPTTTDESEEKSERDMKENDDSQSAEVDSSSSAVEMSIDESKDSSSGSNDKLEELNADTKPTGRRGQDRKAKKQKRSAAA